MSLKQLQLVPVSAGGTARRRPPYFRGAKKLAILGATLSIQYTPWHDPSWILAAHPCCRPNCKREPDWYFDLHRPECFTKPKGWNPTYHDWLKRLQTPIFMQAEWPEIPMSVRYPMERIVAEFRSSATGRGYFTNHVAYMIALAMTENVDTIGLFGCQYSADTEHGVQRGSAEYWMGRFEQAGGRLVVSSPNNILSQPRGYYGYESHDDHGKLLDEYRPKLVKVYAAPEKPSAGAGCVLINPDSAVGRPPLMELPEGMKPAWERSGHQIYA